MSFIDFDAMTLEEWRDYQEDVIEAFNNVEEKIMLQYVGNAAAEMVSQIDINRTMLDSSNYGNYSKNDWYKYA